MKETPEADEQSKQLIGIYRSSEAVMSKTANRCKLLKQWWAISTGRYSEAIDLDVGMEQAVGGESPELAEPRKVEVLMVDWIRSNADRTEHSAGCILWYVNQLELFCLLSISAGGVSLSDSVKTYRHSEQIWNSLLYACVILVWYSQFRTIKTDLDMSVQVFIASDKKGWYIIKVDHVLYNPLSSNYKVVVHKVI